MRIRPGAPSDAGRLAEFAERIFRETFAPDNRAEDMAAYVAANYGPAVQARELGDAAIGTLVAEDGEVLAGFAQLRGGTTPKCVTGAGPVELWRFYVDRAWQGTGLAGDLMRAVRAEAARRGCRTLWLAVWERNPRAMAFYRKVGFAEVGAQEFVLGRDRQHDRVMVRSLP